MYVIYRNILILISAALLYMPVSYAAENSRIEDFSTRKERNFINDGNKLFKERKYEKALECYEMALTENALSEAAMYNRALTMYQLGKSAGTPPKDNKLIQDADSIFRKLGENVNNTTIKERSFYNAGNLAFESEAYDKSVAAYKKALKVNPYNQKTRQNLHLALKKKNEQDKDKNNQQQQQQQPQEQQPKEQEQQQQPQQQQPQPKDQLSGNSEQILKAMQAQENKTRKDNEKTENANGLVNPKPW